MTPIYKEVDFCGIYLSPFFLYLLITGFIYLVLHQVWDRLAIQRWVWNRPIFELALFVILLAAVTFLL
jgi:hypothetical protein